MRRSMKGLLASAAVIGLALVGAQPAIAANGADDLQELQEFAATHQEPVITAEPGSASHDAQVLAKAEYWEAVPWGAYFAEAGYEGIDVTVGTTRGDDGVLTAWWSTVVPSDAASLANLPVGDTVATLAESDPVVARASSCVNSGGSYGAKTCIYNNVGAGASSAQWTNGGSIASVTLTFRGRVGYNQYSGSTCTGVSNIATGPTATIGLGSTYVLNYTSSMSSRYGFAGYNSALTSRLFLDCINSFI